MIFAYRDSLPVLMIWGKAISTGFDVTDKDLSQPQPLQAAGLDDNAESDLHQVRKLIMHRYLGRFRMAVFY